MLSLAVAVLLSAPPNLIGLPAPEGVAPFDAKAVAEKKPKPLFIVIDTPYEIFSGLGSYLHAAIYRDDFTPARNAVVYLDSKAVALTDDKGTAVFYRTAPTEERSQVVRATLEEGGQLFAGEVGFTSMRRTDSFDLSELFVYLDRGVYNPGSTIHVRAVAWQLKGNYKPVAQQPLELRLTDERGRLMGGRKVSTDAFGVATLDLPLPEEMPEGRYQLQVQYGSAHEVAKLRVERVAPPAIEIKHDLKRYFTPTQDVLAFEVTLSQLGGGPLGKGQLTATLELHGQPLGSEKRAVDGSRAYRLAFEGAPISTLRQRAKEGEVFQVVITATDGWGRSDTVRRDLTYLKVPYRTVIEADKDQYTAWEQALVQVKLVDVEGVPVRAKKVRLEVDGAKAVSPSTTDGNGVALFRVTCNAPGTVVVRAFVEDVATALAQSSLPVMELKPMLSKVLQPVVKERRQVPISVTLTSGYVPTEPFVHGDVVDSSGALVSAFLLPISEKNGKQVASGSFSSPAWGTMLLTLFVAAKPKGAKAQDHAGVGLLTEGQQITVHPDQALSLTLNGLPKDAVLPGAQLALDVAVKDARGRPADGVLGATVVDAAILSLMDPMETTPADRFYNPELKVLSTSGSKILTWPVVSRNWGENQMDIALPPFGFQPGGSRGYARMFGGAAGNASGFGGLGLKGTESGGGGVGDTVGLGGIGTVGKGSGYGSGAGMMAAPKAAAPAMKLPLAEHPPPPASDKAMVVVENQKIQIANQGQRPAGDDGPAITVRTRFPETSLWAPRIPIVGGRARLELMLPDAITRQALTLVASDKKGGIGLLRQDVQVQQELYARTDFPPVLGAGDEVEVRASVRNLSAEPRDVVLSLTSDDFTVIGDVTRTLKVEPQSSAGARYVVRTRSVGRAKYRLTAIAGKQQDVEEREVSVRPKGAMLANVRRGTLEKGKPFVAAIERPEGAWSEATLSITFPGAAGLFTAFQGAAISDWLFWEVPGTRAASAWQMMRLLDRQKRLTPERRAQLEDSMQADFVWMNVMARDGGGAAFWRTGAASPYLTVRSLEGLTALKAADFPVRPEVLRAHGDFLLKALGPNVTLPLDDIAWWEGDSKARRDALTAEAARALCEAGPDAAPKPQLGQLLEKMRTLMTSSADPLAAANAALSLKACGELKDDQAAAVAKRMLELRRDAYWEPSWFNAYGGTLEATAAVLELLAKVPEQQAAVREAAQYLLGTRDGFGGWHNGAGTVAVLRALAAVPFDGKEVKSTIRVALEGRELAKVAIDPADPFGSALALSRLELTGALKQGKNALEVTYDGALAPFLVLEERLPGKRASPRFTAVRTLQKGAVAVGEDAEVRLTVTSRERVPLVAIEEPLPPSSTVDVAGLDALVAKGEVKAYRLGSKLTLYVDDVSAKARTIVYRLQASRPGKVELAPTVVRPLLRPDWVESAEQGTPYEVTER